VAITDLPDPVPGSGDLLLNVDACGICGTDVKTFLRGHPLIKPGSVLGHEVAGTVLQAEPGSGFKPGDQVAVAPYASCGECAACRRGRWTICDRLFEAHYEPGGFAERIRVPAALVSRGGVLKLPPGLDPVHASFAEPLACCVHGLDAMSLLAGDTLLVIGDGPMGLLQSALARHRGVRVVLAGRIKARMEVAARVADEVIDDSATALEEAVRKLLPDGADGIVISAGEPDLVAQAVSLARRGGVVNLFAGLPRDTTLPVDAHRIHYDEVTLLGTFGFGPRDFALALDLLAGGLPVSGMITRTVDLEDAPQALAQAARYETVKTVVVNGADPAGRSDHEGHPQARAPDQAGPHRYR
jgi:L-iditol 2-dehydrogenase